MNAHFRKLHKEVPHLKRLPSEYMRSNVWFTTQPVEEPEPRSQLADVIEWMGWDRVLFATDYPHWDFDDPAHAQPIRMTVAQKLAIFRENARAVYGFQGRRLGCVSALRWRRPGIMGRNAAEEERNNAN